MDATAKDTYGDLKAYANGEMRGFLADVEELLEKVGEQALTRRSGGCVSD